MIPVEIEMLTYRTLSFKERENSDDIRQNLDLIGERREVAALRETKYKATVVQHYNARAKNTQLKSRDLVLLK